MKSQSILPYGSRSFTFLKTMIMLPSLFSKLNTPRSFHLPHLNSVLSAATILALFLGTTPKLTFQSSTVTYFTFVPHLQHLTSLSRHTPLRGSPCTPSSCILLFICISYSFSPGCLSHSWCLGTQAHGSRQGSNATSLLKASWFLPLWSRQNQTALPTAGPPGIELQHKTYDPLIFR